MTREERNALVLEALPTVRKHCLTYAAVRRLDYGPVVSDGYLAALTLAEEYDPSKGDWLHFIAMRLRYRLVDIHRGRVGRGYSRYFEQRIAIRYPLSVEYFTDDESGEVWWPEPVDYCDPCDELACADAFTRFCERLDERTREMVALRLDGWSMADIGARYGVTESRVSQILGRLRPELERELVA